MRGSGRINDFREGGFAFIELLVVILIIAILAAIAVSQYQKTVVKSKNARMKQFVQTVANAVKIYYLDHGEYPVNFNQLDVYLPLTPVTTNVGAITQGCNLYTAGTDSIRKGDDFYVVLGTGVIDSSLTVAAYWSSGGYRCGGFAVSPFSKRSELSQLHCVEKKGSSSWFPAGENNFCVALEHGSLIGNNVYGAWRGYTLP